MRTFYLHRWRKGDGRGCEPLVYLPRFSIQFGPFLLLHSPVAARQSVKVAGEGGVGGSGSWGKEEESVGQCRGASAAAGRRQRTDSEWHNWLTIVSSQSYEREMRERYAIITQPRHFFLISSPLEGSRHRSLERAATASETHWRTEASATPLPPRQSESWIYLNFIFKLSRDATSTSTSSKINWK